MLDFLHEPVVGVVLASLVDLMEALSVDYLSALFDNLCQSLLSFSNLRQEELFLGGQRDLIAFRVFDIKIVLEAPLVGRVFDRLLPKTFVMLGFRSQGLARSHEALGYRGGLPIDPLCVNFDLLRWFCINLFVQLR